MDDLPAALRASSLFTDFTEVGVKILASVTRHKTLPGGTPIFLEGTQSDALYIVHAGEVVVRMRESEEVEVDVAHLTSGDHFGELALLGAGPRLASAYAVGDCEILEIARRDFARLQRKKPQACLKLLMVIVARFGQRLSESRDAWQGVLAEAARGQ